MIERQRLPNRRAAVVFDFVHADMSYRVHVGLFQNGSPSELFLNTAKQDSSLDAFAADASILISLLLQRGSSLEEIGHALRRTPQGAAASLIGAVVDRMRELTS